MLWFLVAVYIYNCTKLQLSCSNNLQFLNLFSDDNIILVRYNIAKNEICTNEIYNKLVNDKSYIVRSAVAKNAPLRVAKKMINDREDRVKFTLEKRIINDITN